jgi:hypothetical protein
MLPTSFNILSWSTDALVDKIQKHVSSGINSGEGAHILRPGILHRAQGRIPRRLAWSDRMHRAESTPVWCRQARMRTTVRHRCCHCRRHTDSNRF